MRAGCEWRLYARIHCWANGDQIIVGEQGISFLVASECIAIRAARRRNAASSWRWMKRSSPDRRSEHSIEQASWNVMRAAR